jgi:predicted deacetylase
MNSSPPQYLIRLDDFCPTMLRDRRERFLEILASHGVSPIVAVVPDNQDPGLIRQPPDLEFWDRMRSLQAAGATIAMHGFRHVCSSRGPSVLGLHEKTEFAGVDPLLQQRWIRAGLAILRDHGLRPRLFVAPRHGFDRSTLHALAHEGLGVLSDGFARRPFTRHEILWIPQQLWEPVTQKTGLWTICLHTNTAPASLEQRLERFIAEHKGDFTSFDRAIGESQPNELNWSERIAEKLANQRVRVSNAKSPWKRGSS